MPPTEFLSLIVEITIAIAGFSGIVVVLGSGRNDDWEPIDLIRFRALLYASFVPLSGSGVALLLLASDIQGKMVWTICSGLYAIVLIYFVVRSVRSVIKADKIYVVGLVGISILATTVAALLVANALWIQSFWPFALGLGYHIFVALLNFGSLLLGAASNADA